MKRYLVFTSLMACLLVSCKKDEINPDLINQFTVNSNFTKTAYYIWVIVPSNYNPMLKYESTYVLDADAKYLQTQKVAHLTDAISSKYQKQNTIVIGISSSVGRSRDFTPTATDIGEGGSENYTKFITSELIPEIEKKYSVDRSPNSRLLIGHSLGGLLCGYFFTRHPDAFHNYIMLSPSFWYDDHVFFNYEQASRAENAKQKTLVFIGCGELEETTVVEALEWKHRLSTFYPNSKNHLHILKNRFHQSSALENAEIGLDFYFKNH